MFKYIAILALVSQVLAKPGMGGMGMNPWMSQWMSPGAAPWAPWMPQAPGASGATLDAPVATFDAPVAPFASPFAAFAKGGMAIGAMNKQMGMAQAVIGSKCKAASDEVKAQLDILKSTATLVPADPCGAAAEATAADIETQLLTAFEPCKMKDNVNTMRMQSLQFKQQMAAFKMAKKACKASLDPTTCLADASAAAGGETPTSTVGQSLADLNTKADQCIEDTREALMSQIENAHDQLLVC